MKEALWGTLILVLGLFGVVVVNIFQEVTIDNDRVYYLIKESTEAAAFDALDLTYYRISGDLKIVEDKFVENLTRRFAQNVTIGDYTIVIQDISQVPPKISLKIKSGVTSLNGERFDIGNRVDAIIETKYTLDEVLEFLDITEEEWEDMINKIKIEQDPETNQNTCKTVIDDSDELECIPGDLKFDKFDSVNLPEFLCDSESLESKIKRVAHYKVCTCGKWEAKSEEVTSTRTYSNNVYTYTWNFNKSGEIRSISQTIKENVVRGICTTGIQIMVPEGMKTTPPVKDDNGVIQVYEPSSLNAKYEVCPEEGIVVPQGMKFMVHPNYIPTNSSNRALTWRAYNSKGNILVVNPVNPSLSCTLNSEGTNCLYKAEITANEVGTTNIVVRTTLGQEDTCQVRVYDGTINSIDCNDTEMTVGDSEYYNFTYSRKNANKFSFDVTINKDSIVEEVTGTVVTVEPGKKKIKLNALKAGTATITITEERTGISKTCNIKVKAKPSSGGSGATTTTTTTTRKAGCFLSGTKVLTINGYKDIDKIKINDKVLSYNEETMKNEYKKVTNVFKHKNMKDVLYTISINNKVVEASSKHRFYVKTDAGYKWIAAEGLKIGYKLMDKDGKYYAITNISRKNILTDLYNLEVEDNHNYYVTKHNILVHNAKTEGDATMRG